MIRKYHPEDLETLKKIHSESGIDFQFPDLDSQLMIVKIVCTDENEKIVGAGFVKLVSEGLVILDMERTTSVRALALEAILRSGIAQTYTKGIDSLHVFIKNEDMSKILLNKFGFNMFNGKVLFRGLNNA